MPRSVALIALLTLAACGASSGASAPPAEDRSLGWLAGTWRAPSEGGWTEEAWAIDGDGLLGLNRTLDAEGRVTHHELLRVDAAGYVAAPAGQAVTRFGWDARADASARFANPAHDFPRWIAYRRDGASLVASIGGETREPAASWTFARVGEPPARAEARARACREGDGLRVRLEGCGCTPTLRCAALGGALVVAVTDRTCDACVAIEGVCHAPTELGPAAGCDEVPARVLTRLID